jgi:alpha-L-fucosidase 2
MLLQSHIREGDRYVLKLLPALPDAWANGEVTGLRVRGGCEVSLSWKEGKLVKARIKSDKGETLSVRYKGQIRNLALKPGQTFSCNDRLIPVD